MTHKPTTPHSILFVVPRFHTNIFVATKALVKSGYKVSVFAVSSRAEEDHSIVQPVVFGERPSLRKLRRAMKQADPDLVFLRTSRPLSYLVAHMCSFGRRKLIHYNQRPLHFPRKWYEIWEWWLQGLSAERVTPRLGNDLSQPADRYATYLPWPVEAVEGITRVPRHDGPLRVICVGKLMQPRKSQDKLIEAMEDALQSGHATLTLVGSTGTATGAAQAHYNKLHDLAKRSNGAIRILENIPYSEMPQLYARHDLCVLPSRNEPLGTSPIEAMAYGTAPLVTTGCGSACYITHRKDGFVVEQRSVPALKAMMDELIASPELVAQAGRNAAETAKGELGPQTFVKRVETLLDR
ncbi:glycosyltransferase family 4 protein [Qingshengfaniella alkalisoli]|uniref:Glycosyltransferase family 4 protein n=1 Tax=Qingshengfaniella alkalisoli TaxID=2599296 RepID=A0A5B8IT18_9RHOB|nr:glycosyltransferase family 4 protein [Qingshengfaniella alkalisoli]QDY69392.1 glycosyltransferase family 4 protein [Qingshengfaniella alkalisoli]